MSCFVHAKLIFKDLEKKLYQCVGSSSNHEGTYKKLNLTFYFLFISMKQISAVAIFSDYVKTGILF